MPSAVIDLDLTSPEVVADPYPHFARAREVAPVQWHDGLGMWLTFTHAAADAVLRTRTLGRLWGPRWPDERMPFFDLIHIHSLLENEPPTHTRLRRLLNRGFTPELVADRDLRAVASRVTVMVEPALEALLPQQ